jgi:hypothetical protein
MGKFNLFILPFLLLGNLVFAQTSEAVCRFDMKDYDSTGYSIPKRNGFYIEGRFGCIYRCTCPNGSNWKVNHVHEEKHIDLAVFSKETGGASRAKWFICPHSVKEDSWTPFYDEVGRIIAYNVEPNYEDFPVSRMSSSPQVQDWLHNSCQKP